jgi:hypothetical protein
MSQGQATRTAKNREQVETELLEELQQRHLEWRTAFEEDTASAYARLMDALAKFNKITLERKVPGE